MSAGWSQTHRRQRLLTDVLAAVEASGDPAVPHRAEVQAVFGDVDAFLLAAHHRWSTAFLGRLDAVLEEAPDDLEGRIAEAWAALAVRHRGLRLLLDGHRDRPALAAADERLRRLVRRDLGVDLATARPTAARRPAPAGPREQAPRTPWWARCALTTA